ncbi:MAG TPA: succinate dehydrogenase cytochrome b subunit [Solirubrobacteraceae bacterium]
MSTQGHTIDYRPHRLRALWRSTIGKKYVVAVTGLLLAGFVIAHMLGNLKAIEGPGAGHAAVDSYAHFLRTVGSPVLPHDFALWIERITLVSALVLHLTAVTQLYLRNRAARSTDHRPRRIRSTIAARTMPWTGLLILVFVIFHVLQFSTLTIHPTPLHQGTVYANAYYAFQKWWIVLIYVGAVVMLGFHINHGLWSGSQTAGVDNPDRNWFWRRLATGITLVTVIGFALVPTLFWTGALPKPVEAPPTRRIILGLNTNGAGPFPSPQFLQTTTVTTP